MLKIKSNTNEFTIIFSEKIGKKKNAQKISFSLCSVQHPFFFSPSFLRVSASFPFFCFYFQRPSLFLFSASPFCFFSSCLSFLFSSRVPFFSAQNNSLFNPKTFFFNSEHFCFSPKPFSVQPTPLFQPFFLFVGSVFCAPFLFVQRLLFFFLFQRLIHFFLPTSKAKNILFRCFTFLLFE